MHATGVRHRTLGAYFPDLPSNMLGSFLMGLLAASGTLGIPMANSWPSCQSPTAGRSGLSAAWAPALGSHMTPARLASTNAKRLAQRRGA